MGKNVRTKFRFNNERYTRTLTIYIRQQIVFLPDLPLIPKKSFFAAFPSYSLFYDVWIMRIFMIIIIIATIFDILLLLKAVEPTLTAPRRNTRRRLMTQGVRGGGLHV